MTQAEKNKDIFLHNYRARMHGSHDAFVKDYPTLYQVIMDSMVEAAKSRDQELLASGEAMKVKIHLQGCDDCTIFEATIPSGAFSWLTLIANRSKEVSDFDCMPTMTITKIEQP